MRSIAYAIAILAAAGIMFFLTMSPEESATDGANDESVASSEAAPLDVQTASLTMNVPEMHCPFACYPSVKEKLEKRDDVMTVELAPQKEEGVIDNPQVIVTYKEGFDANKAIAMLAAAGFDGSSVVEK